MAANRKVAAIFTRMAQLTELLEGDRFRINAFNKAARIISELEEDLADIGPDVKELQKLDGIGKGAAQRIASYLKDGRIEDYDELCEQVPDTLPGMLEISGLGPKTVALMWKEAGVEGVAQLKRKLDEDGGVDELAKLPGLGKKKLENIKKSLDFAEASGGRINIGVAMPLAQWFVDRMRQVKGVKEANYAGSLRRGKETIGDLDILVAAAADDAPAIFEAFWKLEPVDEILVKGPTKSSIRTSKDSGVVVQVDLRVVEPSQYGAALAYFTGSKDHNVKMRQRAIDRGWRLNEYALAKPGADGEAKPESIIASATEQDIYKALDLPWIPPELREDRGEIPLAEQGDLPELISVNDIQAELHAHTTASDGKWSIRELAIGAEERGFHTVAITDHSKSQVIANGLDEQRLEQHIEDVRAVAAELKDRITVLAGSEVDILGDGSLDYSNTLLKELDLVVASPHVGLSQDPKKATSRLLKAIKNPYVTIIGHPTGRLINRREGLSPDMKKLIEAAKDRGIALEINANHMRLDLRDTHARAAIEAGVMLAINTDAHGPGDLDQLRYGVLTARRAGATKKHVVNAMAKTAFHKWLKATRR